MRERGIVKFWRHTWGIITTDGNEEVFVHFSDILSPLTKELWNGDRVEFLVTYPTRGPKAVEVVKI